ncbi:MAG: hypothetical protein PWQ82_690 [Thermosediminibacterales bacterium]|nr:hypothetical protein [Thermosediminibacterales bacterium]MDK2836085.1 hypothetical protein [Thermosediminibacterales bacterium]
MKNTKKLIKFPRKKRFFLRKTIIGLIIIILTFIAYYNFFESEKTILAEYGSIKSAYPLDGIIIREEQVVKSPITGQLKYLVNKNRRVRYGETVAVITKPSIDLVFLENRLREIERRIDDLKTFEKADDKKNTEILDQALNKKLELIISDIEKGDFFGVIKKKEELLTILNKGKHLGLNQNDSLKQAEIEREMILNELKKGKIELKAPFSGIVSFRIDGLEDLLKPEKLQQINPEKLLEANSGFIDIKKEEIKAGEPVFKIVNNFNYYIVSYLEAPIEMDIKEGNYINISACKPESPEIKAKVYKVINSDDGKTVLILQTDQMLPDFTEIRKICFQILSDRIWGIKLPLETVINRNGVNGVWVLENKVKTFKQINIIGQNADSVVVEGIKRWEKIILPNN